jgi:hypothetical protein
VIIIIKFGCEIVGDEEGISEGFCDGINDIDGDSVGFELGDNDLLGDSLGLREIESTHVSQDTGQAS